MAGRQPAPRQALGAAALFVIVWTLMALVTPLPGLSTVLMAIFRMIEAGTYVHDITISLFRFTEGWAVGATLGIAAGLLTGLERRAVGSWLEPNLHAFRAVPVIALVPLAVFLWGSSEISKVSIIGWGVFFPTWVSTHNGALAVNPNYANAARSLGVSGRRLWREVYIPNISEAILSGLRIGVGIGLICVAASELTGSLEVGFFSQGLGYRIQRSADLNRIDSLLACLFTFGAIGWLVDRLFVVVSRPLVLGFLGFDPRRSILRVGRSASR